RRGWSPFIYRNIRAEFLADVKLTWSADRFFVLTHFFPLCDPTRQSTHGKHDGKHVDRDTQRAVDDTGIEVYVGIQFAFNEVRIFQRCLLKFHSNLEDWIIDAEFFQYVVRCFLNDLSAWIEVLIDAVSKAHKAEATRLVFCFVDPFVNVSTILTDILQHEDYFLVCAAVQWAPKRVNTCGDGRIDARLGRTDD